MSLRRNLAYVAGALAVVSAISGIVAWWLPASAKWLDRHGFAAWPLALLSLLLFVWAAMNWHQAAEELAAARAKMQELVPADRQLFADFKAALPKESPVITWLRNESDSRYYRRSDIQPLANLVYNWRDSDQHFVNAQLEAAAKQFVACGTAFLSYQNSHAYPAPQRLQTDENDTVYRYFGPNEGDDQERREVARELGEHVNRVLAAHNALYMLGSRLGL